MVGNVTNVAAGITGAFQAVAGGLQAMGVESEAIDSAIAKMQGLMAVTQGLSAIDDGIKSFAKLGKSVQTAGNVGAKGMGKLKKALIGTGIGAIVVLVGSLIANWEEFSQAIGISEGAMQKFGNMARGVLNALMESIKGIGTAISRLVRGDFSGAADALKAGFQFGENYQAGVMKAEEAANQKRLAKAAEFEDKKYQIQLERLERFNGSELDKQKKLLAIEQQRLEQLKKQNAEELEIEKQLTKIYKIKKEIANLKTAKSDTTNDTATDSDSIQSEVNALFNKARNIAAKTQKIFDENWAATKYTSLLLNERSQRQLKELYQVSDDLKEVINKVDATDDGGVTEGLVALTKMVELKKREIELEKELKDISKSQLTNLRTQLVEAEKESVNAINEYNRLAEEANKQRHLPYNQRTVNSKDVGEQAVKVQEAINNVATLKSNIEKLTQEIIVQDMHIDDLKQGYAELSLSIKDIEDLENIRKMNVQFEVLLDTMSLLSESTLGLSGAWKNVIVDMQRFANVFGESLLAKGKKATLGYFNSIAAAAQAAGSIMTALSEEQDAQTEEGFEQQKKYQIGATALNIAAGIVSAWTSAMSLPTPFNFIAAGVNTAAMLAVGGLQMAQIKQQQFGSDSTNTANPNPTALASTLIAPTQYSNAVQNASTEGAIKNAKVYVLESDITSTIGKVSVQETENRY
jgi:hypothetical protein